MSKVIGLLLIMLLFSDYTFEQTCEGATVLNLGESCSSFPTVDYEHYTCVSNEDSNTNPCREVAFCNYVQKEDSLQCEKYPVSIGKKEQYVCKKK